MKPIIALALALTLSGCAAFDNFTQRDPAREVIAACGAITHALNVLTPNKHRLSDSQVETVDQVVDTAEPICTADDPPASQAAAVENLLTQIAAVQTSLIQGDQ